MKPEIEKKVFNNLLIQQKPFSLYVLNLIPSPSHMQSDSIGPEKNKGNKHDTQKSPSLASPLCFSPENTLKQLSASTQR